MGGGVFNLFRETFEFVLYTKYALNGFTDGEADNSIVLYIT
jgi:hypothetical protein